MKHEKHFTGKKKKKTGFNISILNGIVTLNQDSSGALLIAANVLMVVLQVRAAI